MEILSLGGTAAIAVQMQLYRVSFCNEGCGAIRGIWGNEIRNVQGLIVAKDLSDSLSICWGNEHIPGRYQKESTGMVPAGSMHPTFRPTV
jgi:hypothetical protein